MIIESAAGSTVTVTVTGRAVGAPGPAAGRAARWRARPPGAARAGHAGFSGSVS
jgi:hypothetical protein